MKRFLLVLGLLASVLSAVAQGTINAKNSGSLSPLLAANGTKLSAATGRFEVLLGDKVLSTGKNTLAVDGVFTAGVLTVPGVAAGGTATITVRAWDTGAGATYALAQAAGFGFGSSTFQVIGLGGDLSPPPSLDNFKGIRLADRSVVVAGTFNAKNSATASPLLVDDGSKLSVAAGRVEVLFNGTVLNTVEKTLVVDGVFSLGVLTVPGAAAGGSATITVRAWDVGAGASYAVAEGAGFGFGSSTFSVTGLGGGVTAPPALDNFKGIRLAGRTVVSGGTFNAKNSSTLSPLLTPEGSKLPVANGRVEVVYNDTVLNTAEKTLEADGVFSLGVLTVPGVAAGGNATITVRAWDTRAGATYALAQAAGSGFGSATFSVGGLGGGLTAPPAMENFKGIRLSSGITTVAGTFNAKNSATASPLLAADGSKLTVANGRFEILHGDTLLSMLNDRLDVDGVFSDGVLSVPGVPVGGTAAITIRAWDIGAGATYALAQAAGFGFGSATFDVVGLGGGLTPTPAMDNFKGIRLAPRPVAGGGSFNAKNSATLSPLLGVDGLKLTVANGRFEVLFGDTLLSTAKNTLAADGVFAAGVLSVPGIPAGGTAAITVRAWDVTAGATYALAQAAGTGFASATFDVVGLGGDLTPPPALDNFKGLRLSSTAINQAPTVAGQSVTTPEDVGVPITFVGKDPENAPLVFTIVTAPKNGTITGTGANRTYTPQSNFSGTDSFTFKANDGKLDSAAGTVSIVVTPVNDAPRTLTQSFTTDEDIPVAIKLVGDDAENDPLAFIIVAPPKNGTLSGTGANLTYTPKPDFNGTDPFTYKVNDGKLDSAVATIGITVTAVNDRPLAGTQTVATPEDTALKITLAATDAEKDALTFTIVAPPKNGALTGTGANLTYTPKADFNGTDSFTFKANDGKVDSAVATVAIVVTAANDAPKSVAQSTTTAEDTAVAVKLAGTDTENDTLSFTIVAQPKNGTLSGTGANRTYTPKADFNGTDSFTFKVNDGKLDSDVATVTVVVTAVNDAPKAVAQSVTTAEDTAVVVKLAGTDIENDTLTFVIVTEPKNGTLTGTGANRTYTPKADFNGTDSFTFKANDGKLDSDVATVTVVVTAVNDAPKAVAQVVTTSEDTAVAIKLAGTDVENDALTFTIVAQPKSGTLTGTGVSRTYTPKADHNGTDSFTIKANDGKLDSEVATIAIIIAAVNDAPVAAAQSVTTPAGTPIAVKLAATDVENDTLTFAIVAVPKNGTLTGTGASRTYTPKNDFSGTDTFTFKANDGKADSDAATVTIKVTPVNRAPVAIAQVATGTEDTALPIRLEGTDADGDVLSYTVVAGPKNGSLAGTGAARTYTPGSNYNGTDSFTFKVNDGKLDSATVSVGIVIAAVNDAPKALGQSLATVEGKSLTLRLSGADIENDPLTYIVVAPPKNGVLRSGLLGSAAAPRTYVPNAKFSGAETFTFKVNDGKLDSTVETVTINVTRANKAPVAIAQKVTTAEDTALKMTLAGTDEDKDPLTYLIVAQPKNGTLTGTGSTPLYTPKTDFNGTDSFKFKVNDGAADSDAVTVEITVTPVNDAPVAVDQAVTTPQSKSITFKLNGVDTDNDSLKFTVLTPPKNGVLRGSTSADRSYTPKTGFKGTDTFTYKVNDGKLDSPVATVTVTVTPRVTTTSDDFRLTIRMVPDAVDLGGASEIPGGGIRKAVAPVSAPLLPKLLLQAPVGSTGVIEWCEHLGGDADWQSLSPVTVGPSGAVAVDVSAGQATGYFRFVTE